MRFVLRGVVSLSSKMCARGPIFGTKAAVTNGIRQSSTLADYSYETLNVTSPKQHVYQVEINRPEKRNAMNKAFWREMVECFNRLSKDTECRAVLVSGAGKLFTAGLDIADSADVLLNSQGGDPGRRAFMLKEFIHSYQESFTSVERCPKPVIAAVHNACIGGGIDLITACDIRYCTEDAWFQIKEVDIGLAADVGTLQRLPKIVGNDSLVRELSFTGRKMHMEEAKQFGLVSGVFSDRESMIAGAIDTAVLIASKSPVAVQGSKINLIYARDHSVPDSLNYVATWNQAMLQSEDLVKAVMSGMQKETPEFSNL